MNLLGAFLRVILYGILAALVSAALYYSFPKSNDGMQPKSDQAPGPPAVSSNAPALPPVAAPIPAAGDIIKTVDDNSALANNAKASFEKGDFKTAADLCRQLAGKNKKAFLCAGLSYFRLRDYANAITYLEQALEAGADEFVSCKYSAFAYYYRDNFGKSLLNTEKALNIASDKELTVFYDRLMKEKKAHRNFVDESTTHFRVQFDGYEHGGISRKVIGMLEDAYAGIGRELNYYPAEPITVILYTNQDFYDITRMPSSVLGFFDKRDVKIRIPVRGADKQEALLRTVVVHEYVHALIHSISCNVPLWIHEGMAEYFPKGSAQNVWQEYIEARKKKVYLPDPSRHPYWGYHYAVSRLIEKYSMYRLRELLEALSSGKEFKQAFQDTYKISIEDFLDSMKK